MFTKSTDDAEPFLSRRRTLSESIHPRNNVTKSAVLAVVLNRSFNEVTEVREPADLGVPTPLSNYGVVYVVMGFRKLRHWVATSGTRTILTHKEARRRADGA